MGHSILVVEDEVITRDILTTWLEEAGYEAHAASNGLEGLFEVRESTPDLVVADIMMPQMNGYELCRMMRQLSGTPFIFLTGLGTENHKRQGYREGANDYLVKPVDMDLFLTRVYDLLNRPFSTSPPAIDSLERRRQDITQS